MSLNSSRRRHRGENRTRDSAGPTTTAHWFGKRPVMAMRHLLPAVLVVAAWPELVLAAEEAGAGADGSWSLVLEDPAQNVVVEEELAGCLATWSNCTVACEGEGERTVRGDNSTGCLGPASDCEHGEGECVLGIVDRSKRLGRRSLDRVTNFIADRENLPVLVAGTVATAVLLWLALWRCCVRSETSGGCSCCCGSCCKPRESDGRAVSDQLPDATFEDRPSRGSTAELLGGENSEHP